MKQVASFGLVALIALASFVLIQAQDHPTLITAGLGRLNGKAITLPLPEYPADAKTAGVGGTVLVKIIVDESGSVISARASDHGTINASPEVRRKHELTPALLSLTKASEKAAKEAKFQPTVHDGVAVQISGQILYEFVPGNPPTIYDGRVLNGKTITMPKPAYPDVARKVRANGTVWVEVTVDEKGDVISAVAREGHKLLRAAAVKAAREAKFWPWALDGVPMKRAGVLWYEFVAPDEN